MHKTDIIIQARTGSRRLPGKVLKTLAGFPMLYHIVERCRKATTVSNVIVATTTLSEDDAIVDMCKNFHISYSRGSANDVLERYYEAARQYNSSVIVRVTSDCPLIDPGIIDACVTSFRRQVCDYVSNVVPGERTFPRGLDVEVFSFTALERAHQHAQESYTKEHVTPYIWENKTNEFILGPMIQAPPAYKRNYRLTVDYPEDFSLMEKIYQKFYLRGRIIYVGEVLAFLDKNPQLLLINAHCIQKEIKPSKELVYGHDH